ncbi:hypothetical protein SAMN05444278_10385 [Psychroflexus salarius]|uniref:Chain length determinant protein n=1 Tax=Psychroflexus salarius TaxID=1155689 RepID=A0A1M4USL7_9FLAO|nr:hypothetical protein [Psychroflexus salarius]SHE59675.1 hypothetical protein SAMN05444278_10385 [Psychroflexus salarius]
MQEKTNNDEIDLFEFFKLIKKGFNKLGLLILKLFVFVKRNAILFIALIVVGGGLGYYLDKENSANLKSTITLQAIYNSKDFLYESIEELNWDILNRPEVASKKLNLDMDLIKNISFELKPITNIKSITEEESVYLEYLSEQDAINKEEINKAIVSNTILHSLIIYHNEGININELYQQIEKKYLVNTKLKQIHQIAISNKKNSIEAYETNIRQIDTILGNYSKKLLNNSQATSFYNSENNLNVAALLEEKKQLLDGINNLKLDIEREEGYIIPLNDAKTSQIDKSPTDHKKILLPLLLIVLFFGLKLLIFLNKKANQLQANSDD